MVGMETILINTVGGTRKSTLNGRPFLVANLRLIVPGVLPGSKGPLLYPLEEIVKNYHDWNGMPLVGYHPVVNGKPVSARNPSILNTSGLGWSFNTNADKSLDSEGWFDVANVVAFDKTLREEFRILPRLLANKQIELSTGLYTVNLDTPGVHNGVTYNGIATNYKPDHIAILPDQVGACSLKDGCGVIVNVNWEPDIKLEDCSCKDKPTINTTNTNNKDTSMKDELVKWLTTNCKCFAGKEKVLNELTEDDLKGMKAKEEKDKENEAVANAARKGFKSGNQQFDYDPKTNQFVSNTVVDDKKVDDKKADDTTNNKQKETKMTLQEWENGMPEEAKAVWNASKKVEAKERARLVNVIITNASGDKDKLKQKLMLKSIEDLEELVDMMPKAVNNDNSNGNGGNNRYIGDVNDTTNNGQGTNNNNNAPRKGTLIPLGLDLDDVASPVFKKK